MLYEMRVGRQSRVLGYTKSVLPAGLPYMTSTRLHIRKRALTFLLGKLDNFILKGIVGNEGIHFESSQF